MYVCLYYPVNVVSWFFVIYSTSIPGLVDYFFCICFEKPIFFMGHKQSTITHHPVCFSLSELVKDKYLKIPIIYALLFYLYSCQVGRNGFIEGWGFNNYQQFVWLYFCKYLKCYHNSLECCKIL